MTTILNTPERLLDQYISGTLLAHPHLGKLEDAPVVYDRQFDGTTIPILSGGGSGHEPAHLGFVGRGMLTAAVYGPLFVPPAPEHILAALRFLHRGQGVFVIVKNFAADVTNFSKAIAQARQEGIPVQYVLAHDDISVDVKGGFKKRHRGLAGTILLHKLLGAASQGGASLDDLYQLGMEASLNMATIGFATKSAKLPMSGEPLFDLAEGYISYGVGIHGEEGYRVVPFQSSEQLAIEIVNKLKLRFRWQEGQAFILLVNNLGATPELEQAVFLNDIYQLLDLEGLSIPVIKTGRLMTSLDMAGISVTLCQLSHSSWLDLLAEPTSAFAWP